MKKLFLLCVCVVVLVGCSDNTPDMSIPTISRMPVISGSGLPIDPVAAERSLRSRFKHTDAYTVLKKYGMC